MIRFRMPIGVAAILAILSLGLVSDAGIARESPVSSLGPLTLLQAADEPVVINYWQLFRSMWGWTIVFLVIAVALTYRCWRHYFHDITEDRICPVKGESGTEEDSLVTKVAERFNAESFVNNLEDRKATLDVLRDVHDQLEQEPSIYARVMHRGIEDLVEYLKAVYYKKRAGDDKIKAGYYRYSEIMKPGMAEEMLRLSGKLERKLYVVDIIAATAPMIGLLGTVWGMIRAFEHIAASKGQEIGRAHV